MRYYFACVFFNFVINLCSCEIKFIQTIIRHGDRNPIGGRLVDFFWPNDQYKNSDWPPDGPIELTNTGKMNAFKLGKFFHDRYSDLFGEMYKSDIVFFEAVRMTRTINTAQLVAAGLFPRNPKTWNPDLLWTPVPIHSSSLAEDTVFAPLGICQNYQIDRMNSEADMMKILRLLSDVTEFFNYLSLHTGINHTSVLQSYTLYHQFTAQVALGLVLEPWTAAIFPDGKLRDMVALEYALSTYTKRMKRLLGGVWIKKFLNRTETLLNNGKLQRGFFHVGNEIQVAAILNTLGVYQPHMPGFASAFIFELHEINGEFYVKVLYRNEENLSELVIPGCKRLCLLSKFRDILKEVILENFEEDCGKRPASMPPVYSDIFGGN